MKNVLFICIAFLLCIPPCYSASDQEIKKSAEKVVAAWSSLLSEKHHLIFGQDDDWCVYRSHLNGSLSYDIKKTDSIISPYLLIIFGNVD